MSPLAFATGYAALVLAFESVGLARGPQPRCSAIGGEVISQDLTSEDICRSFSRQLVNSLLDQSVQVEPEEVELAIAISKKGSISAQAAIRTVNQAFAFPEVTLDVSDRALAVRDLDHLAISVAMVIARELQARGPQ